VQRLILKRYFQVNAPVESSI